MRIGVHLPLLAWDDAPLTLIRLLHVARTAERNGLDAISANDHPRVFATVARQPDGSGAHVLESAPTVTLMTTVALPVIRGPVALAKALAAVDLLSGGRLIAGLGPSPRRRLRRGRHSLHRTLEQVRRSSVRARCERCGATAGGVDRTFLRLTEVTLTPRPARPGGPPIFIGELGRPAGLAESRSVGRWLARLCLQRLAGICSGRIDASSRSYLAARGS